MRIPVAGGLSQLVMEARVYGYRCAKSPSTLCAFGEQSSDHKQLILTALDPLSGRGRELVRFDTDPTRDYDWDLSPDGSRIVIRKNFEARLDIISLTGGPPQQVTVKGLVHSSKLGLGDRRKRNIYLRPHAGGLRLAVCRFERQRSPLMGAER